MTHSLNQGPDRAKILKHLDGLVRAGRVSEQEADLLRSSANVEELEARMRDSRRRHLRMDLDMAIERGAISQQEANTFIEEFDRGDDLRVLGALRRRLRHARSDGKQPRPDQSRSDK